MSSQSLSLFISHKVARHKRAAERIKEILESRTDLLSVQICEAISAGDKWQEWIAAALAKSHMMLVLVPEEESDLNWISYEVGRFQGASPNGRIVVFKPPSVLHLPDFIHERQMIGVEKEQILENFLKPLYNNQQFTGLDTLLNPRMLDTDLKRDAEELEKVVLGLIDTERLTYGESLVVEIKDSDSLRRNRTISESTVVRAPNGCEAILGWTQGQDQFTWAELKARADDDPGKGTFWIDEMQEVMADVATHITPRVMTSTFRGRSRDVAGRIYSPQLHHVDLIEKKPVRFQFEFYEVLVPELVRGKEDIGDVFDLLHVASRVRWEVFQPYYYKYLELQMPPTEACPEDYKRDETVGKVSGSLRVIEEEAKRQNIFDKTKIARVFQGEDRVKDRELLFSMIEEREGIRDKILNAKGPQDFPGLMSELERGLKLNVNATVLLAKRFLELAQEDRTKVESNLKKFSN